MVAYFLNINFWLFSIDYNLSGHLEMLLISNIYQVTDNFSNFLEIDFLSEGDNQA